MPVASLIGRSAVKAGGEPSGDDGRRDHRNADKEREQPDREDRGRPSLRQQGVLRALVSFEVEIEQREHGDAENRGRASRPRPPLRDRADEGDCDEGYKQEKRGTHCTDAQCRWSLNA